jgi:sodium-dependent dicarboxylate transporter 2/3/5
MYGGAVALGETMARTHAADWLATSFLPANVPGWMLFPIFATICIALSEAISNAAVVALLVPVGFGMCHANPNLDPVTMIYMIAIPAGLGYTLPMSGPPCAIAYSAGYFRVTDVLKDGLQVNVVSLIIIILVAYLYWPLVGLNL